jgi:hypothetical protein
VTLTHSSVSVVLMCTDAKGEVKKMTGRLADIATLAVDPGAVSRNAGAPGQW